MNSTKPTNTKLFGGSAWVRPADDSGLPNQWICFRSSVDVRRGAHSAADLRIACDSRYWLWWNGKLIVREGGLKRGGDPLATFFDEIDLRAHITDGPNTVAILLWYFGRSGFTHHTGPTPLLRVHGAGVLGSLRTSTDWKARRHPAFYDLFATQTNHRIPKSQFGFDAPGANLAPKPGPWMTLGKNVNDLVREQEELYAKYLTTIVWKPEAGSEATRAAGAKLLEQVEQKEAARLKLMSEPRAW